MSKPLGKWQCKTCGKIWLGRQLNRRPKGTAASWICGNPFCGGGVIPYTPLKKDINDG